MNLEESHPSIQRLDAITVAKIAAGEVIDRPASIVKELIENALDAGATSLRIAIEDGGKKRICVTDNGRGMNKHDLSLAPQAHTTSKIQDIEDIYSIESFGFRGEALASMCHAAHVTITSSTDGQTGYEISILENQISELIPVSHKKGTSVDVRDLFFNIPVRQKFLKSTATEWSYCYDVVRQYALLHPLIDIVLTHDGNDMLNTTGVTDLKNLAVMIVGKSLAKHIVPISTSIGPIHYDGLLSVPTLTFSNRSKQFVSVNGRMIKSTIIQKAITQAYKDLIPARRFPFIILNIHIDSENIDVNIHPQKLDIKFLTPALVFESLPKVVRVSLQTPLDDMPIPIQNHETRHMPERTASQTYHVSLPSSPPPTQPTIPFKSSQKSDVEEHHATSQLFQTQSSWAEHQPLDYFQVLDTYIVLKGDDGIWLLDQHAVHERILYEQLKKQRSQTVTQQPMLVSEVVTLSKDLMAVFSDYQHRLSELGFVIELFGESEVIIRELPSDFVSTPMHLWLTDYLGQLKELPSHSRNIILDQKERLQMSACKAAIKAGKRLHTTEVIRLLRDLQKCPSNYTCPHGRPLFIKLDKDNLEKLFMRT